jgi:hypothetical protein
MLKTRGVKGLREKDKNFGTKVVKEAERGL